MLASAGIDPVGFAAPHGRWNAGLDAVLAELGYRYSSDFQLGYDDSPSSLARGSVLARAPDARPSDLRGVVPRRGRAAIRGDRRLPARVVRPRRSTPASSPSSTAIPSAGSAGFPRSCGSIARTIDGQPWSGAPPSPSWRDGGAGGPSAGGWSSRGRIGRWRSSSTSGIREYPLGLEILRGRFRCSLPVTGAPDGAAAGRSGLRANRGSRADAGPRPPSIAGRREPQRAVQSRNRLGDRDSARRDPAVVDLRTGSSKACGGGKREATRGSSS